MTPELLLNLPVLYTFRRCPYAMRARLAIAASGVKVAYREILLRDKPEAMLERSPKGTVPVLVLPDQGVIDESLDIMLWALAQNDPGHWLTPDTGLVTVNDQVFKHWLDRYKYADRYPEYSLEYYRSQGERFLQRLERQLLQHTGLTGPTLTLADYAIAPFIRQFAHVDKDWFLNSPYSRLRQWLDEILCAELFQQIMVKYPVWHPGNEN